MAGTYRVKVKDGDWGHSKDGGTYGQQDYVKEFDNLSDALQDFLEWTNGNEDDKVTLQFRPGKGA